MRCSNFRSFFSSSPGLPSGRPISIFDPFWVPEGSPWPFKNMDSVQYIYQNSGFKGFHLQDRSWKALGSALEHMGEASELFLDSFGGSFGKPDRSAGQQNSPFCCLGRRSNDFLSSKAFQRRFWVIFGSTFGCSELLFVHFFLLFGVGFFRSLSEGHCGSYALHFSHALEAFCFFS